MERNAVSSEQFEYSFESAPSNEVVFEEYELDELAAELLSVTSEAELDLFLGKVFKKVGRGLKKVGSAIGKGLKAVAKVALPIVGKMAGSFFGGPLGGMIGGKLGSLAGKAVGKLELEGVAHEDREFEAARRFVQFAGLSARNLADAPPAVDSEVAAMTAMTRAASQLERARNGRAPRRASGTWERRGRMIVIHL